jgi:hypothetical protein
MIEVPNTFLLNPQNFAPAEIFLKKRVITFLTFDPPPPTSVMGRVTRSVTITQKIKYRQGQRIKQLKEGVNKKWIV